MESRSLMMLQGLIRRVGPAYLLMTMAAAGLVAANIDVSVMDENDVGLGGVSVDLWQMPSTGRPVSLGAKSTASTATPSTPVGVVRFTGLPLGTYFVVVHCPPGRYCDSFLTSPMHGGPADPVTFKGSTAGTVALSFRCLPYPAGVLNATVKNSLNGLALASVPVDIWILDGAGKPHWVGKVKTDPNGGFLIKLGKGRYFLVVHCPAGTSCDGSGPLNPFDITEDKTHDLQFSCDGTLSGVWAASAPGFDRVTLSFQQGRFELAKQIAGRMYKGHGTFQYLQPDQGAGGGSFIASYVMEGAQECETLVGRIGKQNGAAALEGFSDGLTNAHNNGGAFRATPQKQTLAMVK